MNSNFGENTFLMKKILIINNGEQGTTEFTVPIASIVENSGLNALIIEYKETLGFKFEEYSGIIMSGSPKGDDIVEHHLPFFRWIENSQQPIFGICAGHHITGYLFGSDLLRSQEPESGVFEVKILKKDPILDGFNEKFRTQQMHNDSITLPDSFDLLATSSTCKNQLMKHKSKPIYTSQFHPEFYNQRMITNFLRICID